MHTYEKGGQVIALLRDTLGDEGFRESLAHFIRTYAYQSVQTDHLVNAIREKTGKNTAKFFDQWIYGAGYPELKVSVHYDSKKKATQVRILQTAKSDEKSLWEFPATITITQANGKENDERVQITKREHRFSFPTNGSPLNVVFDHPNVVLKSLTTQKPREMWAHQLRHDSLAIQRTLAAQELSKTPNLEEIYAILERIEKDPFWGTRIECTYTLRQTGLPEVAEKLMKLYAKEKDHRVQRALVDTLSYYRIPSVYAFLKKATERTDSYIIPSEAYRGIGRWKNNADIAFLKKGLTRKSWMDLIPTGIVAGLMNMQSEAALKELIHLTSTKYNDRVRRTAASAISMVGGKREEAMNVLLTLTKDPFILIQNVAVSGLGNVGDERAIPELEKLTKGHRDGRVKRAAVDSIRLINGGLDLPPYKEEKKGEID
jgi:aminopeptidase N